MWESSAVPGAEVNVPPGTVVSPSPGLELHGLWARSTQSSQGWKIKVCSFFTLPFPATDVDWRHGHPGERPSHRHLPLLLRQCSKRGLWDNDLSNKGSGFSFARIAAQFRLPDAIVPWCCESVTCPLASLGTLFCAQDPLCCHKSMSH